MTVVVKLLALMLIPVAAEPDATVPRKPSRPVIAVPTRKVCSLADEDYPRLLQKTLRSLTKRQIRKNGEPVDFFAAAKHLSRMISLGLPAAELDRQLWKDITDHRRYQGGAMKGAGVGTTLADEGRCALHADQYTAYYLGRARLQYHRRIARAGCRQPRAFQEALSEHAAWLKAVGCQAKPAKEEVGQEPERAKRPDAKKPTAPNTQKAVPQEGNGEAPTEGKKAEPAQTKKTEPAQTKKTEPAQTKKPEPAQTKKPEPEEGRKTDSEKAPKPIPDEPKKAESPKKKPAPIEAVPQREMEDDF